ASEVAKWLEFRRVLCRYQEGATTAISLSISANGIDSGLTTTDGHKIYLEKEGNLIVGRVDSNNDGLVSTAEIAAFAIAIDNSGKIGRASCRERAYEARVV